MKEHEHSPDAPEKGPVSGPVAPGGPSRPRKKRLGPLLLLLVLAAAAAGGWLWHARHGGTAAGRPARAEAKAGAGERPQPVRVSAVGRGDFNVHFLGLGTVTPLNTLVVRSRVDGELLRVLFHEGQMVKAGDLLAEIDPRPFQVQLEQAQGQMLKDGALLANARQDLARYKALVTQNAIAQQQVDTQEALVRQYEGAVKTDQAQIDAAKLQLVYSRITAPGGGRLGLRLVDPGNMVHASDSGGLVVITQMQPISVIFTVTQAQLPEVLEAMNAGRTLTVEAWDREQRTLLASGTLLTMDNQIDIATGTVKLKASFDNSDGRLFPNQFVNARLLVKTLREALLVPVSAVQRGASGTFVYVVTPERKAQVRPVTLGPTEGDVVVVDKGVEQGELLVVDGVDRLRDGTPVDYAQP